MLTIVIMMAVILAVAGLVLAYAAFPHRGERMPRFPWLGRVLGRAADAAPTMSPEEGENLRNQRQVSRGQRVEIFD